MTLLVSFASDPTGGEIHQPESQSCCMVVAAGISLAFVGSLGMNADGIIALCIYVPSLHFDIQGFCFSFILKTLCEPSLETTHLFCFSG